MANKADVQDAWLFVKREMNTVYNMVDAAPFCNMPDVSTDRIHSHFFGFKLIAERLAPSKLPTINHLEQIILNCHDGKISDKKAFFEIKAIAERFNLDPGLIARIEQKINSSQSKHYDWKPRGFKVPQVPAQDSNYFRANLKPFKMPHGLKLGRIPRMRKNPIKRLMPQFKNVSDMFGGR